MTRFYMIGEDIQRLIVEDQDKYLVTSWIIFNTNYQAEYKDLKQFESYITINGLMDNLNLSRAKIQRILKELLNDNMIEYTFKSNTKNKPSIIKANFIANNQIYHYDNNTNNDTVNNTDNNTNNNTVVTVENTKSEVVDKTNDNTNNNTNNNTDNLTLSKYNNLNINLNDLSKVIVNSSQLELIKEKCCITGEITEQQQREIQNMKMKLLEEVIEKCNRHKSSYNINYLLTAYRNISPWAEIRSHKGIYSEEPHKNNNGKVISGAFQQRIDPPTNKKSMSERLGVENLNHYSKYDDLEDRLLKRQAEKRKNN